MTENLPRISHLQPVVLSDNRRVMFDMVVENLPDIFSNVTLTMPAPLENGPPTARPNPDAPSPYPNVELTILNSRGQAIATTFIVEYKEKHTNLTLHLRQSDPREQYTARAEMTYRKKTLEIVEVPFTLNRDDAHE